MRIVGDPAEFADALATARREAAGAFGDDRILIEKYLDRPRHIEVQIFADRHGNVVHVFDRDCSIQRRHQKVIEEAPAPRLDDKRRRAIGKAAVKAARAAGYVGAGTVEFMVPAEAPDTFYFIEVNTRLQVEHTVTEAVSGLDLVEWQLRVAAGEALPARQEDLAIRGHAIEARLYAEDPERDFLPQTGTLYGLQLPPPETARVDSGVREGDVVTPFYDPMIAKIIVWGEDRGAAVRRLRRALAETAVLGLRTNLAFLTRVAAAPDFASGTVDTEFIKRHADARLRPVGPAPDAAVAAAALIRLIERETLAGEARPRSGDAFSPWGWCNGWRLGAAAHQDVVLLDGPAKRTVEATRRNGVWRLRFADREVAASGAIQSDGSFSVILDGVKKRLRVLSHGPETVVFLDGESWRFEEIDPLVPPPGEDPNAGRLTAPMPGRVTLVLVRPGSKVRRGEPLMVIEAMKMEHTITAPAEGVITAVQFAAQELVEEGAELITLGAAAADSA